MQNYTRLNLEEREEIIHILTQIYTRVPHPHNPFRSDFVENTFPQEGVICCHLTVGGEGTRRGENVREEGHLSEQRWFFFFLFREADKLGRSMKRYLCGVPHLN